MPFNLEEVAYRLLPRVTPGRALADSEWRTLVNVAEAMTQQCPVQVTPERIADNVERFLISGRSRRAWRIRVLLTIVEQAARVTHGRPMSALSVEQRRELMERKYIEGRGLWSVCAKVRLFVLMGTYGDGDSHSAIGFVPLSSRGRTPRARSRSVASVSLPVMS